MATVQLRNPTEGCGYFDREKASGKTANEARAREDTAMRALKRRLSDIVLWQRDRLEFHAGFSEKSLPGPAIIKA